MRRILVLLTFIFAMIIIQGCTVQKKRGEVSTLGKLYHNTTALYNGYFNADVIMQESKIKLESQYQDNYNLLLPLYPFTSAGNPKVVAEELDNAIEKVSIVATIHEPSQWVDDCYVLLGKAQFMKQDYESAEKTFEYFADEFDPLNKNRSRLKKKEKSRKKTTTRKTSTKRPTKTKAPSTKKKKRPSTKKKSTKKKSGKAGSKKRPAKTGSKKRPPKAGSKKRPAKTEDKVVAVAPEEITTPNGQAAETNTKSEKTKVQNPPNTAPETVVSSAEKDGMFGHKPVYQEGLLWLARTYIHRERFSLADYYIKKVSGDPETPEKIQREIPVVEAFYHIGRKNYNDAIPALERAIGLSKNKYDRARYTFIIAQLHQMSGRQDKAFLAYNEVIKMHPEYEMEFNAELNLAKAAWASGQEGAEKTVKKLEKMAKEEKNFDYRDQIYFTLGTIHLKLRQRDLAIENFRESIKYNVGNQAQSAESYLALATYFYEEEEYDNAKYHYDSTLITLPKTDGRYDDVKRKSENLKDIALNMSTIKLQDSLLKVSAMDPEKQRELAAAIKKKRELSAKPPPNAGKRAGLGNAAPVSVSVGSVSGGKKSNYFAYDINKVRRGQNEFRKKWGSRPLEDDWRRSNKPSSAIDANTSEKDIAKRMTEEEVREILKDVPFDAKKKALALNKIEEAYFNLGKLYRSKLEQYDKSAQALETLFERNANTVHKLEGYYYAYLSNGDLGNRQRANYYLDKLKTEFPDSKFTLSIIDPNYAANQLSEAKKVERSYDLAYAQFEQGQYQMSYASLESLEKEDAKKIKPLAAKIDLLKAMCDGNLKGEDAYITSLNYVVKRHPNTPEETRAKEILRFIKGDKQAFDPILYNEDSEEFKMEPNKLHYVLVVLYSKSSKDMTSSKISVSTFNQKNFKEDRLKLSSIFLNKEEGAQIILIRKFRNKDIAMTYYNSAIENKEDYITADVEYDIFAVTQKSYREIVKMKSVNAYRPFFEKNYLDQIE